MTSTLLMNSLAGQATVISICENSPRGNDNTQKVECIDFSLKIDCSNAILGDGNTQGIKCYRSSCENRSGDPETHTSSNAQNTLCANFKSCSNDGVNTNVIAN